MVVARFELDADKRSLTLRVDGHAGAAVPGEDIVCASASILYYTLAQTLKTAYTQGLLKYKPTFRDKKGSAIVSCRVKDDSFDTILISFLTIENGFVLLAHNKPQYVAVEMFGDADSHEENA